MKAKIILLILMILISTIGIYCQTTEPTAEAVQVGYPTRSDYFVNQHQNDFNISTPFLGWMWFSKPVISAMVYANQAHIFSIDEFEGDNIARINHTLQRGIYILTIKTSTEQLSYKFIVD